MTDVMGGMPPPAQPPATTPPTDPYQTLISGLTTATRAAPELRTNPGAAVAVAQNGGDVAGNAQVVAHVANTQALQKAHQRIAANNQPDTLHQIFGWFSHTYHSAVHDAATVGTDIGHGFGEVAHLANAPLNYVQHEYRYIHDVIARHGAVAGALEGLGILAGAAILGVATGGLGDVALGGALAGALGAGSGAVLGGEAAAGIEGHLSYRDSWARTTNGATYRDPNTGQPVSFGRDVAGVIGLKPGSGSYRFVSGIGDAIGDIALDPLGHAGRIIGQARSAEGAHGLLGKAFGGLAAQGASPVQAAEDVSRVYDQYASVRRAFADIAKSTPGDIVAKYPTLVGSPDGRSIDQFLISRLGRATTPEQVMSVFEDAVRTHELTLTDKLPTLTTTRQLALKASDRIANYTGPGANAPLLGPARMARTVRKVPVVYDPEAMKFTREEFSPMDDYGANAVYKMLLMGERPAVARSVASQYINAPTVEARVTIYRNAVSQTVQSMARLAGADLSEEDMRQISSRIDQMVKAADPNVGGVYGMADGRDISRVVDPETGKETAAAITPNQTGKLALPDFTAMRRTATALANMQKADKLATAAKDQITNGSWSGKLDDFFYDHYTQGFFKRLVLLTGGFAARVALSEDIPNALRVGVHNLVRNRIAASAIKGLSEDDVPGVAHWLWNMMGKASFRGTRQAANRGLNTALSVANPDKADFYLRLAAATDGHMVSPGLTAEHNLADELAGPVESNLRSLTSAVDRAPDKLKPTSEFAGINVSHGQESFIRSWKSELAENAKNEPTQLAAQTYLDHVNHGESPGVATVAAQSAVRDWLDAQPEGWLQNYVRHRLKAVGADPAQTPHESWAQVMVNKVLGSVTGDDGTVHNDLLARIAQGSKGPIQIGGWVKAADRQNLGRVVSMTDTHAEVHFYNRQAGTRATVTLPLDQLEGRAGAPGKFDSADLASREKTSWPTQVKGRIYSPVHEAPIERLANVGFRRVLNPMINWLAREPYYTEEAWRQWKQLLPQVKSGALDEDQAMTLAMSRATNKAIRFVHNLNERTQASQTLRNWAPFYFAQEQAYKRVGRLLMEDPGAFRRYQMALSAVHTIGSQQTGPNGQNYFVYPGTGFLSTGAIAGLGRLGIPVLGSDVTSFSGNLSSASVMFPFAEGVRPDVGPVVALPIKAIADLFEAKVPWLNQAEAATLGNITANESFWKAVVPNSFAQRIVDMIGPSLASGEQGATSFNSTFMHTMQALAVEGRIPPETAGPVEMQDFLDRVRNQTLINYGVRALLGLVVPISPQVKVQDWGLSSDVTAYIGGSKGLDPTALDAKTQAFLKTHPNGAGSATAGIQAFLADHPDATPYTVFESTSKTGGYMPDTKAALDWVTKNKDLVNKYPYAAAWLMPQSASSGPYDAAAYNTQIAMGLRQRRTPQDFLNQLYIASGNRQYYDVDRVQYYQDMLEMAGFPTSVAALAAKQGLTSSEISQIKQRADTTQLTAAWSAYQQQYQTQHPIWANDFNSQTSTVRRAQTIQELQEIYSKGLAPKTQQATQLKSLIYSYDEYHAAYNAGRADSWATVSSTDLKDAWQAYLTKTASDFPLLAGVIQSVFMGAT